MRFRVENLGPLREAEVDLGKDLIVLTGPNNTGKTYLAWTVYGLHRLGKDKGPALLEDPAFEAFVRSDRQELDLAAARPDWDAILGRIARACASSLPRVFASAPEPFEKADVSLSGQKELGARPREQAILDLRARLSQLYDPADGPHVLQMVRRTVFVWLLWEWLFPRCILFPAERIAVNMFAKELALNRTELVSELLEIDAGTDPADVLRRRAGRYAWPIRDSLQVANDLPNIARNTTPFADLADDLERAVLGGRVTVSDLGELVFAHDKAGDRPLPVHLTASVVKSLASLVFYFRHMAKPGDFLIIDEPELNLHPDNQRKITRVLAKAVNRGFKIMMSTHSDYVLRELNHLVMLSDPKEAVSQVIGELGYDRASILPPEKLGVYLFKDETAQLVPVSVDGFEVETIEHEIAALNADAQAIYAARFG
ncbi:AAA family ATPase [Polyangium spumosum]|uniref:AAA family ATPase n=1 Tax=Polyangium spumosum TaxID=889282 RepID=A0A6N7PZ82_9BACT|nr:AAA family ATPase [Polyangium spumosum]MRG96186.1 AAA family ATPase [Polyangium spumosum]